MFNPDATVRIERLEDGHICLVLDDALLDAENLRQFAAARRSDFQAIDFNAYPGIYLPPPAALMHALNDVFAARARRLFDARRTIEMHCRFSMVTLPVPALRPYQWLCHSDNAGLDSAHSIQASVLYLFHEASLGGTSFYLPARPPQEIAALFHEATRLSSAEFSARYAIAPGYLIESNDYFRCIGRIEARWNRLIFYDGSLLHTGDIFAPEKLSADPLRGRLTFNGFFTSRRRAA